MTETRPITDAQALKVYPLLVRQQQLDFELRGLQGQVSALIQSFWGEPATGLRLDIEARQITKEFTPNEAANRIREVTGGHENRIEGIQKAVDGHGENGEGDRKAGDDHGG